MRLFIHAMAAVLAVGFAGPALAAGPSCRYAPDIVAFSDILLAQPPQNGRSNTIPPNEFAYLKIKYGSLSNQDALKLIGPPSPVRSPNSLMAEELRISLATPEERLSFLSAGGDRDQISMFLLAMSAALPRALMKDGNLPVFLKMMENAPKLAAQRVTIEGILALAGASLAEQEKNAVAQQLDKAGYPATAAAILASKADIDDWIAYRKIHPVEGIDPADLLTLFTTDAGLSLRHDGLKGLETVIKVPSGSPQVDYIVASRQLQRLGPLSAWLQRTMTREGQLAPFPALLREIDAGKLDPSNLDDLAVAVLAELDQSWGKLGREQKLAKMPVFFQIVSTSENQFPAELFFDTALARRALSPLLSDFTAPPADKPDAVSSNFPWNMWVEVAKSLQTGKQRPDQPYIAAELLQAAGRNAEAAAVLSTIAAQKPEESDRIKAYAIKLLIALVRSCDDEMNVGSLYPAPLYRLGEQ